MAIHRTIRSFTIKWLVLGLVSSTLCSCLGGTIAQQIARSILMQGADKITASYIEESERKEKIAAQNAPMKDTAPDPYKIAFWNSGFETITPRIEPLPTNETNTSKEKPIQLMQKTQLVQVEVWSFLVGDEKQRILEKARIQGATSVPPKAEWQHWQIAVGSTENTQSNNKSSQNKSEEITFLIPPEIGKLHSGTKAFVELSSGGELNIARYTSN